MILAYLIKFRCFQNKAVRIITNSELRASVKAHYYNLGILKLPELYELEITELMHQRYRQNLLGHSFQLDQAMLPTISEILMKLCEIVELVILSKIIPISTNLVLGVKSYGPPKIVIFMFTQT